MNHTQPNGRPVHAECVMIDDPGKLCTCSEAWDYWDGTTEALDRAIEVALAQQSRNRQAVQGRGPDADEEGQRRTHSGKAEDSNNHVADYMGGFWSHAQDLKCKRGDPMRPLVYAVGYTWKRAQAEDEKWERK